MNINAQYKRAVRIVSKSGEMHGFQVSVFDKETGETLTNVKAAVIYLEVKRMNMVELTYYETNEQGNIVVGADREPIIHTTRVQGEHDIDVTAMEG